MKLSTFSIVVVFLTSTAIAESKTAYVAECWAGCEAVVELHQFGSLRDFRLDCARNYEGAVYQSSNGQFVCAAADYKRIRKEIRAAAQNCPAITPRELGLWRARCARAADVWEYGWEVEDCVAAKYVQPENVQCIEVSP